MDGHLNDSAENRKAATPPLYLPPPAASRSSNIYSISTLSTVFIKYPYLKEGWVSVQGLFISHCLGLTPAPQLSSLNYPQYQYKRRPNVETDPKQPDLSNFLWIFCLNMGMFEAEIITYLLILTRDPNLRNAYISHSCWFKFIEK